MTLHPSYLKAWVAVVGLALGLEIATPWWSPDWPWVALFVLGLTVEGVGIARTKSGDTLSEMTWAFLWGGWSRAFLVTGFALYMGMRFYLIGGLPGLPGWAPRAVLAVGFTGWVIVHFLRFGRAG